MRDPRADCSAVLIPLDILIHPLQSQQLCKFTNTLDFYTFVQRQHIRLDSQRIYIHIFNPKLNVYISSYLRGQTFNSVQSSLQTNDKRMNKKAKLLDLFHPHPALQLHFASKGQRLIFLFPLPPFLCVVSSVESKILSTHILFLYAWFCF